MWMLVAVGIVTALTVWSIVHVRRALSRLRGLRVVPRPPGQQLTLYEAAWLSMGPGGVVRVCLTGMFWAGRLTVGDQKLTVTQPAPGDELEAAIAALCARPGGEYGWTVMDLAHRSDVVTAIGERLAAQGLITHPAALRRAEEALWLVGALVPGVPLLMLTPTVIALTRDERGWALSGAVVGVVLALAALVTRKRAGAVPPSGATAAGKHALESLPKSWVPRTQGMSPHYAVLLGHFARGRILPWQTPGELDRALIPPPSAPMGEGVGLGGL